MEIKELSFDEVQTQLRARPPTYYAMYSSWYGGMFADPGLMMVPVDDHMVHRGDGVFEAMKVVDGNIYGLELHLERLAKSAGLIGLKLAHPLGEINQICLQTLRFAIRQNSAARTALIRVFNSRGPGNFTPDPYSTLGSQLYVIVTPFQPVTQEKHDRGVSAKASTVAVKEGFFSTVKSCNYLPNVMMKKEAVDSGVDYVISQDAEGWMAEGPTENFGIVSQDGRLLIPGFERTLRGITVTRAMELADQLIEKGLVSEVTNAQLTIDDVLRAREVFVLGTTIDCLAVSRFNARPVGDAKAGPVARALLELLREDVRSGPHALKV